MLVVGACFRDSFLCCFSVLVLYVGFRSVGWLVSLVLLVGCYLMCAPPSSPALQRERPRNVPECRPTTSRSGGRLAEIRGHLWEFGSDVICVLAICAGFQCWFSVLTSCLGCL